METIVVKIGGSTLGNNDTTLEDLAALQKKGILPVVVHGGGNSITEWLADKGISSRFVNGHRVTDKETLDVVISVLCGLVNKKLVAAINSLGGKAIGLSGIDGGLIQGRIKDPDVGYVGEVVGVNIEPVKAVLDAGYIPVIAPCGLNENISGSGAVKILNINADVVASEIAVALKADKLIFFTDVEGVCDKSGKLFPELSRIKAEELISSGAVFGGMIPKVEACLHALLTVSATQIVDGRREHVLMEALESKNMGTIITND